MTQELIQLLEQFVSETKDYNETYHLDWSNPIEPKKLDLEEFLRWLKERK